MIAEAPARRREAVADLDALDAMLHRLAGSDDPLVAAWASALAESGERASSEDEQGGRVVRAARA